jgi:acyl-CoA reductase-like NAD-dependent aldehyde dehydrogenase
MKLSYGLNNTTYRLAAGLVTKSIDNVLKYSQSVRAGTVWVNCFLRVTCQTTFGEFKTSGFGRESGEEGLREYCEIKTVTIKNPNKNS